MKVIYEQLDSMGSGMAENKPGEAAAPSVTKSAKAGAYMLAK